MPSPEGLWGGLPEGEMTHLLKHCTRLCAGEKCKAGPCGERGPSGSHCFLSHERGSRNQNGTGLLRGRGTWLSKGFGNWNLCGFLLTKRQEGERPILETSHFNQMQSRWGTSCTVSFLAFHMWVHRLPSGLQHTTPRSRKEPWHRHLMEHRGMERFPLMSRISKATTIKPMKIRNKTTWPVTRSPDYLAHQHCLRVLVLWLLTAATSKVIP